MTLKFLRLTGDLGSVIILANVDYLAASLTRCDKTSGKKLVSFIFLKVVGFTGQQGFINFNAALQHLGICRHLISCFQKKDVIQHQFLRGNGPFFSLTQDHSLALREDGQLIQGFFRPYLLDDSDHRVLIGTNQQYHNHKGQVQKVEKC